LVRKAVSSGAKLLIVIIIIATVGVCISCRAGFSGTATYSGTWSTDTFHSASSRFLYPEFLYPDLSGTCTLTVDFDAGRASISLAGGYSGTIGMHVLGAAETAREFAATPFGYGLSGAKMINDWRWVAWGYISREDPDKAEGYWAR